MKSEKIELKNLSKTDLNNILRWKSDPLLARLIKSKPSTPTQEEITQWFDKNASDPLQKLFGIYHCENCIGLARLMFIDHLNSMTELGIYIGDIGMRGKGFGGQAVRELLRWAFVELQLNRVFLKVAASNIAAVKTYKKCGFQEEGLLRQHYCFEGKFEDILIMGILKSEEYKCHSVQL